MELDHDIVRSLVCKLGFFLLRFTGSVKYFHGGRNPSSAIGVGDTNSMIN